MPAPKYQATGTLAPSITTASPGWPTHLTNDIGLLIVESCGGEPATLSTAAGFAAVTNSPQATGSTTNGTQITVFWCRATSNAMSAPTVADPGDHVNAMIVTFRGCVTSGNPWDVTAGGVKAAASTSGTATGLTTTAPDCLVVNCIARDNDSATAAFSAQANTTLSGITELTGTDTGTALGNGGGFVVFAGTRNNPGVVAGTTFTVTSSINAYLTIALKGDTTAPTAGPTVIPRGRCVLREGFGVADLSATSAVGWASSASGGATNIVGGGLRMAIDGLAGGYAESCSAYPATINNTSYCRLPTTDWEIVLDFTVSTITDEAYLAISMGDSNNGAGIPNNGYCLSIGLATGDIFIQRRDAGAQNDLVSHGYALAVNTTTRVRWVRSGSFLGVNVWNPVGSTFIAHADWTAYTTDAKWRGTQYSVFLLGLLGGNVAAPTEVTYRNLMISTPPARHRP